MGFKLEQFVKEVDENLICSICHEVFQDPVNCRTGHTFCRDCIQEWLTTSKKCPMDNGSLKECSLVPVYTVSGIIDNLHVYCHPQDTRGPKGERPNVTCDWTGKICLLRNHKETCSFQQVQCPNLQCNLKMQRREMEDHDKICQYKEVECDACRQGVLRCSLKRHREKVCPEALIACPNKCTSAQGQVNRIKRVDVNDHVTNICAKTKVDCPFKEQGCCIQIERQDEDLHLRENMAGHMTLLAKQCSSLAKQNSSLTEQCSSLTKQSLSHAKQCSSLTKQNTTMKQELNQIKIKVQKQETEILNRTRYTWQIKNYPSLAKKYPNSSSFRSPTFWLCGHSWYLEMYPNGAKGFQGCVSLYLYLVDESIIPEGNIVPSSGVHVLSTFVVNTETFSDDRVFTSGGFGWPKFIKANEAVSSRYCKTKDSYFTIMCTINII